MESSRIPWSPLGGRLLGVGLPGRGSSLGIRGRREHCTFGKLEVCGRWVVAGEKDRRCISRTLLYTKLSLSALP